MFIQAHFNHSNFYSAPFFSAPQRSCPENQMNFSAESSAFSSSASLFLLFNAFSAMLANFQGSMALSPQAQFGLPRNDFNPMACFFGPENCSGSGVKNSSSPAQQVPFNAGSGGAKVKALAQSNSVSCGQTSVAMAVNALTGKQLTDRDISNRHGFSLLGALQSESRGSGYSWRDGGNFQGKNWGTLENKLNSEKTPVIMGLNGPTFSPSGRGHIITLLSVEGNRVKYADPADGKIKYTTKQAIENAPPHPDGKFFFYASKA